MDPAAVLRDFREVDTQRRQAITEAESSKAQRNKASEEIAKLKKSGQDATAAMAQTKELREKISELEKTAGILTRGCATFLPEFPTCRTRVCRSDTAPTIMWKCGVGARPRNLISLQSRIGILALSWESWIWNAR